MTAIDAVIFDWGGTLTPWHVIDPAQAWLATVGDLDAATRLAEAENEVWQRSRHEHRSGTLAEVFALAGVSPTEEFLAAHHEWWTPHTYTDDEVKPLWRALRERGIRIGVLSNTVWPRSVHETIFARDGVDHLIDGAVYTSEIDWTKPHPEAFAAARAAVGNPDPEACVFVGDRLFDDIYGAKQAGMRAVLVPHSTIPAHQHGHTDGVPDATIERLGQLLSLVDQWNR